MEDYEIVELYLSRNEAAIQQTSEKFGNRLRLLAYNIVKDWQTAEECENDAYMQTWNLIPPHSPKSYLYVFLARIIRHISLNCCRERARLKRSAFVCELSEEMEIMWNVVSMILLLARQSMDFCIHSPKKKEIFLYADTGIWIRSPLSPNALHYRRAK